MNIHLLISSPAVRVDGQAMQNGSTLDMTFEIPPPTEHASSVVSLPILFQVPHRSFSVLPPIRLAGSFERV